MDDTTVEADGAQHRVEQQAGAIGQQAAFGKVGGIGQVGDDHQRGLRFADRRDLCAGPAPFGLRGIRGKPIKERFERSGLIHHRG
ncbi:hypothetical protein [Sphingobium sp. YG1]|uniref:hypothetical protein n=1 Tax=Sphingobium sp. YG1 TaxID=2082188 RepID=UPI000DBB7923|nr:hypothetical protein [Sphingobium sp. YG1]BBC99801.1 hypothetical protein YGS_C1P1057 [Sphingobium sp. YG1]